jgi:predicted alpha/beta hydrolase family esterase
MARLLMVPGIDGSDDEHWQTRWEAELPSARIRPTSWSEPDRGDWIRALEREARAGDLVVAHSLGCLAALDWLQETGVRVAGALLVAPPDCDGAGFPGAASSFRSPDTASPVPALVIASSDDPYCSAPRQRALAATWGAALIDVGPHGHLNSRSGLGSWREGYHLAGAFAAGLGSPLPPL